MNPLLIKFKNISLPFLGLILYLFGINQVEALRIHGNWCGPYHPSNFEYGYMEPLPYATDSTDLACRTHDFIYTNYWTDIPDNQMNHFFPRYPYNKQFDVDKLLIDDIEKGLKNGKWGCKNTKETYTVPELVVFCKNPPILKSECTRSKPNLFERMMSRVIQMAMYVKRAVRYRIGDKKENPSLCENAICEEKVNANPKAPVLGPTFCEVQSSYAVDAHKVDREIVVNQLKDSFHFFQGHQAKVKASKAMGRLLRMCDIQRDESTFIETNSRLNPDLIAEALRLALEEEYLAHQKRR